MKEISVIVPIYNQEQNLRRCLDSLVAQTIKNIEFILVNDGSIDNSNMIIKEYAEKFPSLFKIIDRGNKGIGASRNEGVELATGKYIGFVDSDDYVEKNMYKILHQTITKNHSDIAVCDYFEIRNNKKEVKTINFSGETNLKRTPRLLNIINFGPVNKLYKRDLFEKIKFPENLKYEDLNTIPKIISLAKKIVKVDCPLYNYFIHDDGETGTLNYKVKNILTVLKDNINYFKDNNFFEHLKLSLEILSVEQIFSYILRIYDLKDGKFTVEFMKESLNLLNSNFDGWKYRYIKKAKNPKEVLVRFVHTKKILFTCFIQFKLGRKSNRKKILFTAYTLHMGGVEKALVNLVNSFDCEKHDVTVILQIKGGDLLNQVSPNVKVCDYKLSKFKNKIIKKTLNIINYCFLLLKTFHRYDFAGCYGPGYPLSATIARFASKNNAVWMHTNILIYMKNCDWMNKKSGIEDDPIDKSERFLKRMFFRKFKHNIFVSYNGRDAFLKLYPQDAHKTLIVNNIVNFKEMISKKEENISEKISKNNTIFLNVGRHTEHDKRLSRIINACEKLKKDYSFSVIFIGDGEHHNIYRNMVKEKQLEEQIHFFGAKSNPFPYYKVADAVVLSSEFEGQPVVFLEAMFMNVPIITTDVSDAKIDIDKKYGIVVDNEDDSIYDGMKKFLDKGFKIKKRFDYKKYNQEILDKLEVLINSGKSQS